MAVISKWLESAIDDGAAAAAAVAGWAWVGRVSVDGLAWCPAFAVWAAVDSDDQAVDRALDLQRYAARAGLAGQFSFFAKAFFSGA